MIACLLCFCLLFMFCLTFLVIVVCFVEWYTLLGRGLVLLRGEWFRRRIPAAAGAVDATPSGVSRVRVTRTVLRECDIGLHRTVTVDSHRRRTDTRI